MPGLLGVTSIPEKISEPVEKSPVGSSREKSSESEVKKHENLKRQMLPGLLKKAMERDEIDLIPFYLNDAKEMKHPRYAQMRTMSYSYILNELDFWKKEGEKEKVGELEKVEKYISEEHLEALKLPEMKLPEPCCRKFSDILADYGVTSVEEFSDAMAGVDEKSSDAVKNKLRALFGAQEAEVVFGSGTIFMTIPYTNDVSAVIVIKPKNLEALDKKSFRRWCQKLLFGRFLKVKDIVFVNKKSKQSFNYRFIVDSDTSIVFSDFPDPMAGRSRNWLKSRIVLPWFGRGKPPIDPGLRAYWNFVKSFEPIALFHEARHIQQFEVMDARQLLDEKASLKKERDANAYALLLYKQLKAEGLDLLPEPLSNKQLINRIELALISHEFLHLPKDKTDIGSRRVSETLQSLGNNPFSHALRVTIALFQSLREEPSLITDALSYKGTPKNVEKASIKDLLPPKE